MKPWLISAAVLGADQLAKALVVASLRPGDTLPLLPPLLQLTYVQNTGAAFGLFKGWQLIFIGISVLIIVWIVREFTTRLASLSAWTVWGSALLLGGAVGNLIDRLRVGYVIDFLDLRVWPVFNVGDSAITIGVALLIIHSIWGLGAGARGRGRS